MELYKELAAKRCFSREELTEIAGSESSAAWHIRQYLKKGYIERVHRDLYVAVSLETGQPVASRFLIATKAADASCVSHHTAFEYFGCANQVFYDAYFTTERRCRSFSYDGIRYVPLTGDTDTGVVQSSDGVRVTSLERTVVDSIAGFRKIAGLEEVLRCIGMVPSLNGSQLLEILDRYGFGQLYQKTGYILEAFRDELSLSDDFFSECEKRSSSSKTYLCEKQDDFVIHPRWKLYAPKDLRSLTGKGIRDNDYI